MESPRKAERTRRLWLLFALLGVMVLAGVLRLWGIGHNLPDLTIADEFQVVERALRCGTGDLNPHLFTWPGSLPIYATFIVYGLVALGSLLTGSVSSLHSFAQSYFLNPTPFFVLARLLAAGFGIWAVWATYRAGKRSYGGSSGLLSALILALVWIAIWSSHTALPDTFALAFLPLALIFIERWWQEGRWRWILLAGMMVGLGTAAKYNLGFLGAAMLSAPLLVPRLPWRKRFLAWILLVVGGLAGFIFACPFCILDFSQFTHDIGSTFIRVGSSRQGAFTLQHGYLLGMVLPFAMSWPLAVCGLLGLVRALWKRSRMDILLVIFIVFYILVAGGRWAPPKHILPLVGALAILGGRALADICGWIYGQFKGRGQVGRGGLVVALLLVAFFIYPLVLDSYRMEEFTLPDGRALARCWIEENIPPGSSILIDSAAPDVDCPQLLPDEETMVELIAGDKGAGRYSYFLESEDYPFGRPTYRLYLRPWVSGGPIAFITSRQVDYVVTCEFLDRGHYFDQVLLPGEDHYQGEGEYHRWLAENCVLVNAFGPSFGEASVANVYIYKVK